MISMICAQPKLLEENVLEYISYTGSLNQYRSAQWCPRKVFSAILDHHVKQTSLETDPL